MEMIAALVLAAVSIGSFHTLAPDHWVPFATLARAERWSAGRTAVITALCGLGHVTVSVALGLVGLLCGIGLLEAFGRRLESAAGILLIGFGVAYGAWGLHRRMDARLRERVDGSGSDHHHHSHHHAHRHPHTGDRRLTAWALFLLFSADPCVAVIPLMFAAAPLGWKRALLVVAAYEIATIGTMITLVLPARAAVKTVKSAWAEEYSEAIAGGVIAAVGLAVVSLGL